MGSAKEDRVTIIFSPYRQWSKNKCIKEAKNIFATFIDFRKAFDYVDRDLLFAKLAETGITGSIFELTQQMYRNTVNVIWVNNMLTDEFTSDQGVKQGDPISPTHFGLYINGLIQDLKEAGVGVKLDAGPPGVCFGICWWYSFTIGMWIWLTEVVRCN